MVIVRFIKVRLLNIPEEVKMFNCNCRWTETILGVAILIVTLWPNFLGISASWWIVVVAAVILILHAWSCKNCGMYMHGEMPAARRKRR